MIRASELVYEYPGKRALDAVSFTLAAASITALVGPNGAGKTTLLRCLAGLDEPYSGTVEIAGIDVLKHPRDAHRHIGYLPDDFGLYAELSVRRCLLYAGRARGLADATLDARVDEVAAQLEIGDKLADKAGSLSRGQRQRLAIAQSIIHRPSVLLLDEPASGLDPESRAALSGLMRKLRGEGMTLVVSSHILAELEEYCTGMLVLQQARIVEHRLIEQADAAAVRQVRLRLAQHSEALADVLGGLPLSELQIDGSVANFDYAGDDAALAGLLATLVNAGLPVCELQIEHASLQDQYLLAVDVNRGGRA
ncbi:ABC transporter ATP-binding protein [Solimonas terrae]|uniref:ABC transporter ATP-binding protein n=1 Tax=Solimonas terrae TaxID=1396819 RepID=A0A6M2BKY0_9GAMM|nr:ABC transporter ATP-binding protein [Solimonas terrae]NGY03174.1 ABC transporter ATP-binding protein [Solimonas terrae]